MLNIIRIVCKLLLNVDRNRLVSGSLSGPSGLRGPRGQGAPGPELVCEVHLGKSNIYNGMHVKTQNYQ